MSLIHTFFTKHLWILNPDSRVWKFRRKRIELLRSLFPNGYSDSPMFDIGGSKLFWINVSHIERPYKVVVSNLEKGEQVDLVCDGCLLPLRDHSATIFSNSVIEHVGTKERQESFANEVRRTAKAYFIQTPSKYFPVEPHAMFPFFQFLPTFAKKLVLRTWVNSVLWAGAMPAEVYESFFSIRLLSRRELEILFPDGEIWHEKLFGLTKSLVVFKRENR